MFSDKATGGDVHLEGDFQIQDWEKFCILTWVYLGFGRGEE